MMPNSGETSMYQGVVINESATDRTNLNSAICQYALSVLANLMDRFPNGEFVQNFIPQQEDEAS